MQVQGAWRRPRTQQGSQDSDGNDDLPQAVIADQRAQLEQQLGRLRMPADGADRMNGGDGERQTDAQAAARRLRREVLSAERSTLLTLRNQGTIEDKVLRRLILQRHLAIEHGTLQVEGKGGTMTTHEELAGWRTGLEARYTRIAQRFRRSEVRERAKRYVAGLLDRVERKNGWQLAERLGETRPQGVQRLLNATDWDVDAVRDDLCSYVTEHLGEPSGVLIVDETGFLKHGAKSVGVQRQYSGTAGRIEKCQVGVFLAYATSTGRAFWTFLDRALYLPQEWIDDPVRRADVRVPEAVTFAPKPALAQQMLERAFAAQVPAAWVTGDEIQGDDAALRRWMETEARPTCWPYLPASRSGTTASRNTRMPWSRASLLTPGRASRLAAEAKGSGSTIGPAFAACTRLPYPPTADDTAQWLLARRSLTDPSAIAYYRAYGRAGTDLPTLVQIAGMHWAIEEGFEDAKGAVGLDHYEVRAWTAWYRHSMLARLAHAALAVLRSQAYRQEQEQRQDQK